MAKKNKEPKVIRLEDILFSCRDSLRGNASMTEKRDILLTLVFLKFVNDKFVSQQQKIRERYPDEGLMQIMLDKPDAYQQDGVFFLTDDTRWDNLILIEAPMRAVALDNALAQLDNNKRLRGALPLQIFTSANLEPRVLVAVMNEVNKIDPLKFGEKDLIGRVYEYFLQAFSFQMKDNKEEGEFYTPHSIVNLIATLIEPFDGTIGDFCCGSGGMFVQSLKLIEAKGGNTRNVQVYGQESNKDTLRLAKMNLALRGISFDLGQQAASSFTNDQHVGLKVNYIMENPPFNLKKWRGENELTTDPRWQGYDIPPVSNANYAWILHTLSKMEAHNGMAGFLLANGALDDSDTVGIRSKLIQNDKIEAIIVLPRNMFYSTDISVTLWILNNNKQAGWRNGRRLRDRQGEILFVDLRTWNENVYEKKYVELKDCQIEAVHKIYTDWQTMPEAAKGYAKPESYYAAHTKEIEEKGWSLVPSRYIEFVDHDTELDYDEALKTCGTEVKQLLEEQKENMKSLFESFKAIGYDAE